VQNDIIFLFISLLTVPLRENNARLPIASISIENINNSGNYVLPSSGVLHLRSPCKSVENIVFFFPFRIFGSNIFVLE
jgi:hypothetical protein